MNSKSMVIRIRKFLLLVESEKCDNLPSIQLKAKALRWDLELMFKFPEDAVLTSAMHSDSEGYAILENVEYDLEYVDPETIRLTRCR